MDADVEAATPSPDPDTQAPHLIPDIADSELGRTPTIVDAESGRKDDHDKDEKQDNDHDSSPTTVNKTPETKTQKYQRMKAAFKHQTYETRFQTRLNQASAEEKEEPKSLTFKESESGNVIPDEPEDKEEQEETKTTEDKVDNDDVPEVVAHFCNSAITSDPGEPKNFKQALEEG